MISLFGGIISFIINFKSSYKRYYICMILSFAVTHDLDTLILENYTQII